MKITQNISITKSKSGDVWSNITGEWKIFDEPYRTRLFQLQRLYRSKYIPENDKLSMLIQIRDEINAAFAPQNIEDEETLRLRNEQAKMELQTTMTNLINFFSEFSFEPNFRFVNTFALAINNGTHLDYVRNYFKLTDNAYADAIVEKMRSYEFQDIYNKLNNINVAKKINNRFKLYYGSQGTGKTTEAMIEADNNVMICHSAMLPSDLMEDFNFDNGKAAFTPSALCRAITEGKPIVLDEINLLPFESLRFLQSLLDGKTQFIYKGQTINIKDGFKIIGTMNLQVNGVTYALPEPLVDRAEELKEFKLTGDKLVGALI